MALSKRQRVEKKAIISRTTSNSVFLNQNLLDKIIDFLNPVERAETARTSKKFDLANQRLFTKEHKDFKPEKKEISYSHYLSHILQGKIPLPSEFWRRKKIIRDLKERGKIKDNTKRLRGISHFLWNHYRCSVGSVDLEQYGDALLEANDVDFIKILSSIKNGWVIYWLPYPFLIQVINSKQVTSEIKGMAYCLLSSMTREESEEKHIYLWNLEGAVSPNNKEAEGFLKQAQLQGNGEAYAIEAFEKGLLILANKELQGTKRALAIKEVFELINKAITLGSGLMNYFVWHAVQRLAAKSFDDAAALKDDFDYFVPTWIIKYSLDDTEMPKFFNEIFIPNMEKIHYENEEQCLMIAASKDIARAREFLLNRYAKRNELQKYLELLKHMLLDSSYLTGDYDDSRGWAPDYSLRLETLFRFGLSCRDGVQPEPVKTDSPKRALNIPFCGANPSLATECLSHVFFEIVKRSNIDFIDYKGKFGEGVELELSQAADGDFQCSWDRFKELLLALPTSYLDGKGCIQQDLDQAYTLLCIAHDWITKVHKPVIKFDPNEVLSCRPFFFDSRELDSFNQKNNYLKKLYLLKEDIKGMKDICNKHKYPSIRSLQAAS